MVFVGGFGAIEGFSKVYSRLPDVILKKDLRHKGQVSRFWVNLILPWPISWCKQYKIYVSIKSMLLLIFPCKCCILSSIFIFFLWPQYFFSPYYLDINYYYYKRSEVNFSLIPYFLFYYAYFPTPISQQLQYKCIGAHSYRFKCI